MRTTCVFVRVGEKLAGHGVLVAVPVRVGFDVPQVAQGFGQCLPAWSRCAGELVPVIDLLLLKRDKQQRRQLVEQTPDGIDADGQLRRCLLLGLQREVVLAVEVDHGCSRYAMAHQCVCQRLEVPWPGLDTAIVQDPGRRHHHGQAGIDLQIRVQRFQGWLQRMCGDFPDRGAGYQLGEKGILIRGEAGFRRRAGGTCHGHILCEGSRHRGRFGARSIAK
ncbi:hypothetical protein D9M71_329090 [compost metagenome]|uniref:Uncharacterized protein n=1 Tax=Pseudomonas fluorescens TaxID=294 RepID=A0A5E6XZE9_PSEFL|nr:hypothetical protein PS673_05739 [Pseudomonas fluorescens]